MEAEGTFYFLEQFKPLIYKTLQRLNIQPTNMDYDDFFQEFQIQLLKILEKFQCDTTDVEEKNCKFVAYAGQGLYWHGISLLRNKNRQLIPSISEDLVDWTVQQDAAEDDSLGTTLHTEEFFKLAKKRLSAKDYSLLINLSEGKYGMQELADAYGVSRATLYQWKERIQIRLDDLKDCLRD